MFVACWSVKGGAGTTVVAASLALHRHGRDDGDVLVVDLAGDLPAALGAPEPDAPGIAQWLRWGGDVAADGLVRLEQPVGPGIRVLPRGDGPLGGGDRARLFLGLLASESRPVVVDCGRLDIRASGSLDDDPGDLRFEVAAAASSSWLITRGCFLALRRAQDIPLRPSGVVFVDEPGRALDRYDVEAVLGVDVVAVVPVDPAIARAVDAGLLGARLPRVLARALRDAA